MKKLLLGILLALGTAGSAGADDFVYQGSFLWNNIRAVAAGGDFLFGAFHDGVGVVNLSLDFTKKKLYSTLELEGGPRRLHLFDNLLVVETESGTVFLVDVGDPAEMILLGSFVPGLEVFDLERMGDYLYAAAEYEGILRYDISDPTDIRFADSSMAGIRVIDLDVYEARLYALDDYNGILIYEPSAAGFGAPVSKLLLPIPAVSFTVYADTVYAGTKPSGYMVGSVSDVYHPQYLGTRMSYIRGDYLTRTSKGLVLANSINGFELNYDGGSLPGEMFPVSRIFGYPDVFQFGGRHYIAYPHGQRGFVAYDIDDPSYIDLEFPDVVYAYPGPINQVQFHNSRLHVLGTYNWYETYDLSDPARPFRSGKMINPPYRPAGMCSKGDTIFVADRETNTIFPALDAGFGDPVPLFPFFSVLDTIARPILIPDYFDDDNMDLIYFYNDHRLNGTARNEAIALPNLIRWSFPTGVTAAIFDGTMFYRASSKSIVFISEMDDHFQLTELSRIDLPSRAYTLAVKDTLLYIGGPGLRVYNVVNPSAPIMVDRIDEIEAVYEIHIIGSRLICATRTGIHIFDITGGLPQPLFSGGDKALLVSIDDQTIAASDSFSVKIYTLPVSDADDHLPMVFEYDAPRLYGYPNPFNPEINLVLENFGTASRRLNVDVYDILGRRVRRLAVMVGVGVRPEVKWNGRDENGQVLPSGIYLFRAGDKTEQAVFKAILLK